MFLKVRRGLLDYLLNKNVADELNPTFHWEMRLQDVDGFNVLYPIETKISRQILNSQSD